MLDFSKYLGINNFITHYEVSEDRKSIIIYFSNNGTKKVTYSLEIEKLILDKMKRQITESKDATNDMLDEYDRHKDLSLLSLVICLGTMCLNMSNHFSNVPSVIVLGAAFLVTWREAIKSLHSKGRLEDYLKNRLFINNEGLINSYLDSQNQNNLSLNDIDSMSFVGVESLALNARKYKLENR